MKRWLAVIMMALMLCGCGTQGAAQETDGADELWIVTDKMSDLIETVTNQFQAEYPDVTLRIDVCSNSEEELEQLRTEVMAGKGPDVFVFLAENVSASNLIVDVNQFVSNGHCLDITAYYEQDTLLNQDGFAASVMEAGVVDGKRYVLPLRYNMPVIYADVQQLESAGLTVDDLKGGMTGLTEALEKMGENAVVSEYGNFYFYLYWMNLLPELIDYDRQKVLLTEAQLTEFLDAYRKLINYGIGDYYSSYDGYISHDRYWALDGCSINLGTLNTLASNIRIAKAAGIELAVLPLTASDGSVIANVAYYGAVGANTDEPELAYAFLRRFLLEENQLCEAQGVMFATSMLVESGWPVLTEGSWQKIDADLLEQISLDTYTASGAKAPISRLKSAEVTEADYSILTLQPDAVRFLPTFQFDYMIEIDNMLNQNTNPDAMDVNVTELAKQIIQKLNWHLAEG